MQPKTYSLLAFALVLGLIFHGVSMFYTLESTYDALIHLFFADHYAKDWFEPWDYRWYTGFTVQSYPPLVHQCIALLSYVGGLKFGLFTMTLIVVALFITGLYRFAKVLTSSQQAAGYTAILGAFSSMFLETLHVFGQLPSLIGISILLHAMPEIYSWIKSGKLRYLGTSLSLITVMVTSHHVTPIFGMVFFIFPLIGLVLMDASKEKVKNIKAISFKVFLLEFKRHLLRIIVFGLSSLVLIIVCILPYWLNSKNNPITQVPIPHGSRDNFFEVASSGLVFFLIPWGVLLLVLPYLFYRFYSRRLLFFGLSFSLLSLLGTGGTTPLPRLMLGATAFDILTLDRFTLWATIMALPIFGEFVFRLVEGDIKNRILQRFNKPLYYLGTGVLGVSFIGMAIFTMSLGYFRPGQPQKIKMLPIVNFLNQDQHDQWRYLTLGFGDQMAWLSAQTNAMTVDGNYHSARRLPELTSRAIERLENSKFRGVEGIGSLQQFLTVPNKYNLKYIFSNDKFYDPILYFCGWQRLQQLENGIMVWERLNVPPLPKIIPKEDVPNALKLMWGLIPVGTLIFAFICNFQLGWLRKMLSGKSEEKIGFTRTIVPKELPEVLTRISVVWVFALTVIFVISGYGMYANNSAQYSPENVVRAYYDALDFKEFEKAHSYLDPDSELSIAQYMLEVSVSDGLLSSYAKMDSIGISFESKTQETAKVKAYTKWITPLEKIERTYSYNLVKRKGSWYIQPIPVDTDIPPNQLLVQNQPQFFNHGRRRITSQQTYHEDVLRQPILEVLEAKLIKFNGRYSIVGRIQNIDNAPADVSLKGTLYNHENSILAQYDAKYHVKHKLMPKETTPFRIDFEGTAWDSEEEQAPGVFDPDTFTPAEINEIPVTFDLQCAGNVTTTDLNKSLVLQEVSLNDQSFKGTLFNGGLQEVTVPQILVSYYRVPGEILWVEHHFLREGVRVQRKQEFAYEVKDLSGLEVLEESLENCFVNGTPNSELSKKYTPERRPDARGYIEIANPRSGTLFLALDYNSFIGNPK